MHDFLTGPLFWIALTVCAGGSIIRFVLYFKGLSWQLDRVAYTTYPKAGLKGALQSIYKWLIPFGTRGWQTQPLITLGFFGFHLGAVLIPLFLTGHALFMESKVGFHFFTLNAALGDFLSWTAVVAGTFLLIRRLVLPEVRILTTWNDILILLISMAPFVTGLLARYQVGDYGFWLNMHILCGEIVLFAIPFTKLSHVFLFFASRAQLGMDFGIKRGGMKGTKMAW